MQPVHFQVLKVSKVYLITYIRLVTVIKGMSNQSQGIPKGISMLPMAPPCQFRDHAFKRHSRRSVCQSAIRSLSICRFGLWVQGGGRCECGQNPW